MLESSRHRLPVNFFLMVAATSVNALFGLLQLINLLGIKYYNFYYPKIIDITILSPTLDFWVWGFSLFFVVIEVLAMNALQRSSFPRWTVWPCMGAVASVTLFLLDSNVASWVSVPLCFVVVCLSVYYGGGVVGRRLEAILFMMFCVVGMVLFFELASLSTWVWNVFDYTFPFGDPLRWRFALIDRQLFNVFYPLTTWLFTVFLYSWIWIPIGKSVLSRIGFLKLKILKISKNGSYPEPSEVNRRVLILCLVGIAIIAASVAYYSYVNASSSILVGVDSNVYYGWLQDMSQKGPLVALQKDRPISDLSMYAVQYVSALPPEVVLRIMPIICAVCLSLAVFWFVRIGTGNELLALTSALFTVFSFQTTVSVFAYSLANWLAIIEAFVVFVLLLKGLERQSWKYILISSFVGMALLLTHPYTWQVIIAILAGYLGWSLLNALLRKELKAKGEITLLGVLLLANLFFYLGYVMMPFGKAVGSAAGLGDFVAPSFLSLFNIPKSLESAIQMWVGGLFGNPLLVILAVVGMFPLMSLVRRFDRLMLLWVAVPSLVLFILPPDNYLFYRILYVVPVQILATLGLYWMLGKVENEMKLGANRNFQILKIAVIVLIGLFLLNYSLRSVDGAPIHILGQATNTPP